MGSDASAKHLHWLQNYHYRAFRVFFFFIFNIDFLAAICEKLSKLEMFLKIPWKVSKKSINVSRDLTDISQRDWHGTVNNNVNVFGFG